MQNFLKSNQIQKEHPVCLHPLPKLQHLQVEHYFMEKHQHRLVLICSVIISFGLIAISTCILSEFKKSKAKDVKLDGRLCHVPESPAYILGLFTCICLVASQIIGSTVIALSFFSQQNKTLWREQRISITLAILSWIAFASAIIPMGVVTSMNMMQPYGKGWLDGECYLVKDGVHVGIAVLIFVTVILLQGTILVRERLRTEKAEKEAKAKANANIITEKPMT